MDFNEIYKINEASKRMKEEKSLSPFIDRFEEIIRIMRQRKFPRKLVLQAFNTAKFLLNVTESKNTSFEEVYKMNETRDTSEFVDEFKEIILEMIQQGFDSVSIGMAFQFAVNSAYDNGSMN